MKKNAFEFTSYKAFFKAKTEGFESSWGVKKRLAQHMDCQAAYLSQVLKGQAEFSVEQLFKACSFFDLSQDEIDFIFLLHQKDRAGTREVKDYFQKKISEAITKRMSLTQRLGAENILTEQDRATYYSSWIYMAVHFLVGIKEYSEREKIKKILKLNSNKLNAVISFLVKNGLVKETSEGLLAVGVNSIRLGNESPWIVKHHTNWRMKAIENLENEVLSDLHYSGVYTMSEKDAIAIKNILLDTIKKNVEIVKESKEEKMFVMNMDFFNLFKTE